MNSPEKVWKIAGLQFTVSFSNINLAIIRCLFFSFFGLLDIVKCCDKPKQPFLWHQIWNNLTQRMSLLSFWATWPSSLTVAKTNMDNVTSWVSIPEIKRTNLGALFWTSLTFWCQFWDIRDAETLWACAIQLHESVSEVLVMGAVTHLRKLAMSSHGVSKRAAWRGNALARHPLRNGGLRSSVYPRVDSPSKSPALRPVALFS